MKLRVVVELIGGPFDGTFGFDAANPFPGGLSFPMAFAVAAYLTSSTVPVGGEFTLDEPEILKAGMLGTAAPEASTAGSKYAYRVQSRSVSEAGETHVLLQHVAPKPLNVTPSSSQVTVRI